jgi:DNA-directed RNA polymerase subunit alpha
MAVNAKNWQELKKPMGLERKAGGGSKSRATFVAEPLERGFGLTLGNALRRVLLSSLQGAAVTAIKIENVLHEFSSLAGVREDVTDIVLNVKQVALRMQGEGPKRLQLSATGPAEVTAGDIATSGDIEVMNKDLVICHLDEGASLNMELTVHIGKGYVPAAANRPADAPIGLIPVDALYSPVRQVAYKVENTRVGQELDYDKLTITVETDGTVTPEDALAYSARILQDQLQLFVHFDDGMTTSAPVAQAPVAPIGGGVAEPEVGSNQLNRFLLKKVDELELSVRSANCSEDRSGDAAHAEFRPQVAQRDQGSPCHDGAPPRYGNPWLAAREYRGNGQEARTGILIRASAAQPSGCTA